jgi:hypothetical protein
MLRTLCTVRKTAVCFIAVMSVVFALFLVWHLVTPGSIARIAVGELLAVLALFVLPAATAAAWELDRRAGRHIAGDADEAQDDVPQQRPAGRIHPPAENEIQAVTTHRRRIAAIPQRTR